MAERPDIPAAAPDLWLGTQLWMRRVERAGVAARGASMMVSRQANSILPLAASILRRRRSAIAHLGDAGATDASFVWLSGPGEADTVAPGAMAAPQTRAAVTEFPTLQRAAIPVSPPVASARVEGKASSVGPTSGPPTQDGVIQRSAAAASTAPAVQASPMPAQAARGPLKAIASTPVQVQPAPSPGRRRVGAPIRMPVASIHRDAPFPAKPDGSAASKGAEPTSAQSTLPLRPATPIASLEKLSRQARETPPIERRATSTSDQTRIVTQPIQTSIARPATETRIEHALVLAMPVVTSNSPAMPVADATPVRMRAAASEAVLAGTRAISVTPATPAADRQNVALPLLSPPASPDIGTAALQKPLSVALPLVRAEGAGSNTVAAPREPVAMPLVARPAPEPFAERRAQREPDRIPAEAPVSWRAEAAAPAAPQTQRASTRPSNERVRLGASEIGRVADRVYQLLLSRLTHERQRRGA